jgi:hypothetical protein
MLTKPVAIVWRAQWRPCWRALTVMAGFDIIVGEVIGIKSARRDINFGGN